MVCYNNADGTITLNTSGGSGNYLWNWTGPNGFTSTDQSLVALDTGTYFVTITDDELCTKDTSFTITQPDSIIIDTVVTHVDCYGNQNGASITPRTPNC